MLNMFTFDVFSVCHSPGQSVTAVVFFLFWLILYSFLMKILKIQNICMLNMIKFDAEILSFSESKS